MNPIELYIHIPFCVKKCLYCDFLSGVFDEKMQRRYVAALCTEINYAAKTQLGVLVALSDSLSAICEQAEYERNRYF